MQTKGYNTVKETLNAAYASTGGCVGVSDELKGEKQAVVQRQSDCPESESGR